MAARCPVHPRGCGEYGLRYCCLQRRRLVHPRGCGEYSRGCALVRLTMRFIPAGAGNTTSLRSVGWPTSGSSPRVRGILKRALWVVAAGRFIPAGAGNTSQASAHRLHIAVHPRGCGEYEKALTKQAIYTGSSPRVRGIHSLQAQGPAHPRFIPAGAGNTSVCSRCNPRRTVHPRGCGEYAFDAHLC